MNELPLFLWLVFGALIISFVFVFAYIIYEIFFRAAKAKPKRYKSGGIVCEIDMTECEIETLKHKVFLLEKDKKENAIQVAAMFGRDNKHFLTVDPGIDSVFVMVEDFKKQMGFSINRSDIPKLVKLLNKKVDETAN
jgi:hypothetical protein